MTVSARSSQADPDQIGRHDSSSYDVEAVRASFPALREGAAHFDGPGGSQVPSSVADAVADTLRSAIANRDRVTAAERRADDIVTGARAAMGDLLGVDPQGVVFGRSMTSLTFDFARTLAKSWGPGDEVVVSRLDHDANIRPWVYAAAASGAELRWAEFDPNDGELQPDAVEAVLSDRTRLVAVTAASNLIGTRPDVAEISRRVHAAGALCYVDGVHFAAHCPVDVAGLGADFFVCSPYKYFGPHCGVLAARPDLLATLDSDKLLPQTDAVPERFELGTLPYELLAGCTAAVDFIAGLAPDPAASDRRARVLAAMSAIETYEDDLRIGLESQLSDLPGLVSYSRAAHRTPTLLVAFEGKSSAAAQRLLAASGVNAPAGSFYALEASRALGLGDDGALRVGLAPYTDADDISRLVDGLRAFATTSS
jgi:cysteine desulfurase family protein (TIGR01976 family)